jgi:hypothetical protein
MGLDDFQGHVLCRRNLLQRCGMNHVLDALEGPSRALLVAQVAGKVAQRRALLFRKALVHRG